MTNTHISGETLLKLDGKTIPLRLDIGTIMDLEGYYDMSIANILSERLADAKMADIMVFYAAMTGVDIFDEESLKSAVNVFSLQDVSKISDAVVGCIRASFGFQKKTTMKTQKKQKR